MGDMAIVYRAFRDDARERRWNNLKQAQAFREGWVILSEYHWRQVINGRQLDYWPSCNRFKWEGGKTRSGNPRQVANFVRNQKSIKLVD